MVDETEIHDIVHDLAHSPGFDEDGTCFVARSSGLFRSEDAGATWQSAYDSLKLTAPLLTAAVAVSPTFTADQHVFAGVPGGIVRSADGGQSWQVFGLASPPPLVISLAISPNFERDGILFAGTLEDGVFYSSDRGQYWRPCNFGLLDLNILTLSVSPDFADDETILAGTESGIFRSTNGGRAWREVDFPMALAPVLSLGFSPSHGADGVIFAGTEAHGLLRSDDQGATWSQVAQGLITGAVNSIILSPEFPDPANILVVLNDALLVSHDGGQNWSSWEADFEPGQGLASVTAPGGIDLGRSLLVGCVDGRVLRL